jgi:hypothetical protein
VVNRVEKATDVCVKHPIHILCHECRVQGCQGIMRAAAWPKPVREAKEINFVDGAEELGYRTLKNLIFQRGDTERPLATVSLGNIYPPDRLRPVATRVNQRNVVAPGFALIPARSLPPSLHRLREPHCA